MKHFYLIFKGFALSAALIMFFVSASEAQTTLAKWDFNLETLDPSEGSGTAMNVGETTFTWATGVTGSPDRAWNTSTYPEQSIGSGTAGAEFMVSTAGYQQISISFYHRSSGTASRWAQIYYTTNGGSSWIPLTNNAGGLSPHDTFYLFEFDMSSIPAVDDNADFGFRVLSVFSPVAFEDGLGSSYGSNEAYHRSRVLEGSPYGPNGTWRFDDVTVIAQQPVGIGEDFSKRTAVYFQNGLLHIKSADNQAIKANVINILGQTVVNEFTVENTSTLYVNGLQGYFFVQLVNTKGEVATKKVFIP
ncbi:MAG: T9SS type A sorting domain-containing protein [Bacteroidales bacterium]|nr:T9SS type A sorting domain-containing protein [Bacteroidales bacterium]